MNYETYTLTTTEVTEEFNPANERWTPKTRVTTTTEHMVHTDVAFTLGEEPEDV